MSNQPILAVENVSHRYAEKFAITNIAFTLSKAGCVGLLGANGAGKSTLMNIACGLLKPTKGQTLTSGVSMQVDPIAAKRKIGFLPQQAPLYPDLTISEYLHYAGRLRGLERRQLKSSVEYVIERCGLGGMRTRLISALSGGYRQRVGLAQAIIHKPSLIILDEPTNGLDPEQVIKLRSLIKEIAQEHLVFFSSHILREIEALCDDLIMFDQGKLIYNGSLYDFKVGIDSTSALILRFEDDLSLDGLAVLPGVDSIDALSRFHVRINCADALLAANSTVQYLVSNKIRIRELYSETSDIEAQFIQRMAK